MGCEGSGRSDGPRLYLDVEKVSRSVQKKPSMQQPGVRSPLPSRLPPEPREVLTRARSAVVPATCPLSCWPSTVSGPYATWKGTSGQSLAGPARSLTASACSGRHAVVFKEVRAPSVTACVLTRARVRRVDGEQSLVTIAWRVPWRTQGMPTRRGSVAIRCHAFRWPARSKPDTHVALSSPDTQIGVCIELTLRFVGSPRCQRQRRRSHTTPTGRRPSEAGTWSTDLSRVNPAPRKPGRRQGAS